MHKDFDLWSELKKAAHEGTFKGRVHEREVWWCSLGANIGHEEDGKNDGFERPVIVLRVWSQETVVVLPLTTQIKNNRFHFVFTRDGVNFAIVLSQVRLISTKRLKRRIYRMHPRVFGTLLSTFGKLLLKTDEPSLSRGSPEPRGHL